MQCLSGMAAALSCKECGGFSNSEHDRVLYARSAAGLESASTIVYALMQGGSGGSICEHGRERRYCKSEGLKSASTVVSAHCKECGGLQFASTVVCALGARSAVGAQSASTVGQLMLQGLAAGLASASTSSALSVQGGRQRVSNLRAWPPSPL